MGSTASNADCGDPLPHFWPAAFGHYGACDFYARQSSKMRQLYWCTYAGALALSLLCVIVYQDQAAPPSAPATINVEVARMAWLIGCIVYWILPAVGVVTVVRLIVVGYAAIRHYRRRPSNALAQRKYLRVAVLMPAYNEELGIEAAVRSVAASDYPVDIIVLNDGSTDRTSAIVSGLDLPQVTLLNLKNGGKAAALNKGIEYVDADIVVMVDGDTIFQPDTVRKIITPFRNPYVGAVSGNTRITNSRSLLGRWQSVEYIMGFNLDRRFFDLARCMPTVPGAIGAFRLIALRQCGGVSTDTLAEDTDLTMSLCRYGWRVVYKDDAIAWTECPQSIKQLWKQRHRWCYGTIQAMWKHRSAAQGSSLERRFALRGLGYLTLFQLLLPLTAPLVDLIAIYGLFFRDMTGSLLIWLIFLVLQLPLAALAFFMERERPTNLLLIPLQLLCYRPFMYVVVIHSMITFAIGRGLKWQSIKRYGSLKAILATNAGDGVDDDKKSEAPAV